MSRLAAVFALASLVLAGTAVRAAAPPPDQPTPKAAERAAALKAAIGSFRLTLRYFGDEDKPYYRLTLVTKPGAPGGPADGKVDPFHPAVTITPGQAEKVIDHLAAEGFLDRAIDVATKDMSAPAGPCYTLTVSGDDRAAGGPHEWYANLGWGLPLLKRLDGLRAALDGGAAEKLDLLLGRLSGHRREWERPAPKPATAPAAAKAANATETFLGPADQWPRCAVSLDDVHVLWGRGTAVHLRGSGQAVVRTVNNRNEKRFNVKLPADEASAIRTLCIDADLLAAPVKGRVGVPDEGRAVIALVNVDGKRMEVAKWDGDKVEAFDRVYQGLLALRKKTEAVTPEYEGPYQRDWKPAADGHAAFDIKCRKKDDAVEIGTEAGGRTVLSVTSPSGIGGATVERKADRWPDELVLRVRLRGLEDLRIACGDVTLRASVLSHSGNPRLLHVRRAGGEEGPELAKDDRFWADIRAFDPDGKPLDGLPQDGGWFEITVPRALLPDREKSLSLEWIDFFRR